MGEIFLCILQDSKIVNSFQRFTTLVICLYHQSLILNTITKYNNYHYITAQRKEGGRLRKRNGIRYTLECIVAKMDFKSNMSFHTVHLSLSNEWLWARYLTSLNLGFLIWKMRITKAYSLWFIKLARLSFPEVYWNMHGNIYCSIVYNSKKCHWMYGYISFDTRINVNYFIIKNY